ncbi:RxLR effector protein [Phytophthora megakarya]|uniref:RxLR effector protein n=1 Tax=Phytophthora megakarya TaxID=4795 RepID=A0A225W615_9STRA|nr:RxLR effector protein [Phytophthora megakarya]
MRLLLWILVITLVTFISSVSATSSIANSKKTEASQLTERDIDALNRLLADENSDAAKRFLRGEAEKDLTANDDSGELSAESEERGIIPSSITNMITKVKNGWAKWKAAALEKAFKHMMKNGETPTKLAKRLEIGGATEPRYEKLYEMYTAWWINFHSPKIGR